MKNKKIMRKISHGMYVLTTKNGGCMVDAVMQASSSDNPLVAISVMKSNYTNELIHNNDKFALSVLAEDVNPDIIKTFGFNSMRDINKFEKVDYEEIDGVNIIKDSIGYMIFEKVDTIENDTHTIFLGKLIEADSFDMNKKEMTYNYYQEHKSDLIKVDTSSGKTAWMCSICGYIYYGDTLPDGYVCPKCGAPASLFVKQ